MQAWKGAERFSQKIPVPENEIHINFSCNFFAALL
jgi:hypothetical protein